MIWGGADSSVGLRNSGAYFAPEPDTWSPPSLVGAPDAREYHSTVWAGEEMIVWGGTYFDGINHSFNDGGRYDPAANRWTATSTTGAPTARRSHTAV